MEAERSIIQRLSKNRINETYLAYAKDTDNSSDVERTLVNLTALYEFMIGKGFEELPDQTIEKRSLINVHEELKELGIKLPEPKKVDTPDMPGEFEKV